MQAKPTEGFLFYMGHRKVIRGHSKYMVNMNGHVTYADNDDPKGFQMINGIKKYLLEPDKGNKLSILLPEQCILLAYQLGYQQGDTILYNDRNKENKKLDNLSYRKPPIVIAFDGKNDVTIKKQWKCNSKVRSANGRTTQGGLLTIDEVYRCLIVCDFKCFYCVEDLQPERWHLDHALPIIQGGKNEFKNLRASCPTCNMMKGALTVNQFRNRLLRLNETFLKNYDNIP